jgi:ABC-type antimicrobial peptide transport system permease subunit
MDLRYLIKELYYRRRRTRTAVLGLSIGIAVLMTINALSAAYREASREPLKDIGADITIQRSGDVPEELTGAVFPCSAVAIHKEEVEKIQRLPGIEGLGQAVLLWVFDKARFSVVLGVDTRSPAGPSLLRSFVTEGRFLEAEKSEAVVEVAYARQFDIRLGDMVSLADNEYPVVGMVDASRAAKIAVANVYLPLAEAQKIAAASKQVQAVSAFGPNDVNLLFLKVDQKQVADVAAASKTIMGKQATVATPDSFLRQLGSLFALSDKFSSAASLIAIVVACLIVFKTMAGNITERAKEIGILKTVGWTNRNVVIQILGESLAQCFLGGILGLIIAFAVSFGLGFVEVRIPIPWEMCPTPHFLPGGGDPIFKTLRLPVHVPWNLALLGILLSTLVGGITGGLLSRHISRITPSEVLRHE